MAIRLISSRADLSVYVDQIRVAADQTKDAFGFLPAAAYADFADQQRLVVAVEESTSEMIGYVAFGGALPQGRVFKLGRRSARGDAALEGD